MQLIASLAHCICATDLHIAHRGHSYTRLTLLLPTARLTKHLSSPLLIFMVANHWENTFIHQIHLPRARHDALKHRCDETKKTPRLTRLRLSMPAFAHSSRRAFLLCRSERCSRAQRAAELGWARRWDGRCAAAAHHAPCAPPCAPPCACRLSRCVLRVCLVWQNRRPRNSWRR